MQVPVIEGEVKYCPLLPSQQELCNSMIIMMVMMVVVVVMMMMVISVSTLFLHLTHRC